MSDTTPDPSTGQDGADIGVIGMAVMGQNLALNFADSGFEVGVYNRTTSTMEDFLVESGADLGVVGHETIDQLVAGVSSPRKIMLMVKAGAAVDSVLDTLLPLLDPGDVVIDGGNSQWQDTQRRMERAESLGVLYVGAGVSGGEDGARYGPSIMPGGSPDAWPVIKDILQAAAAKADDGTPCCDWIGTGGAGHFVKMVHNGIEYGDMQVIAEAYDLMSAIAMSNEEMAATFADWNTGRLESYLIEITADILAYRDPDRSDEATIDVILDEAGQKGTGRWTAIGALEAGQPLTLVAEAVFARVVSALRSERMIAAELLRGPSDDELEIAIEDLEDAIYASKIVSYAQGFELMRAVSDDQGWDLDLATVASVWRAGCIIRAAFLDDITRAFRQDQDRELVSLLVHEVFAEAVHRAQPGWRRIVSSAVTGGIATPAMSSAVAFFDGYRRARLPANMIQAQRDYFGAHTYRRLDDPDGPAHHTRWAVD